VTGVPDVCSSDLFYGNDQSVSDAGGRSGERYFQRRFRRDDLRIGESVYVWDFFVKRNGSEWDVGASVSISIRCLIDSVWTGVRTDLKDREKGKY